LGGRHDHGQNKSAIVTLVERTSRKLVLIHLNRFRTAAAVSNALISVFGAMPPQMRRSLTWDQGKEMAGHRDLTRAVSMPVYFCQRSSPWQRGSNENMNGLLRDYFPKATDLWVRTADRLAEVANELNDRPRRNLAWTTPAALFRYHVAELPTG
jgi:IS30 family transposase